MTTVIRVDQKPHLFELETALCINSSKCVHKKRVSYGQHLPTHQVTLKCNIIEIPSILQTPDTRTNDRKNTLFSMKYASTLRTNRVRRFPFQGSKIGSQDIRIENSYTHPHLISLYMLAHQKHRFIYGWTLAHNGISLYMIMWPILSHEFKYVQIKYTKKVHLCNNLILFN